MLKAFTTAFVLFFLIPVATPTFSVLGRTGCFRWCHFVQNKSLSLRTHSFLYGLFEILRWALPAILFIVKASQFISKAARFSFSSVATSILGIIITFLLCLAAQWVILISWIKTKEEAEATEEKQ